jgi:uncharacterized glyoxalase superfamily protein PhnB
MRKRYTLIILLMIVPIASWGQDKEKPMKLKALTPNLIVEDVNKTVKYYQETLGFKLGLTLPESGTLDFAIMSLDDVTIMFQSMKGFVEAFPEYKGQKTGGTLFLYIDVINVDEVYKRVKDAKAEIIVDMNETFYGTKEFSIKDCDGYLLIFAEDSVEK